MNLYQSAQRLLSRPLFSYVTIVLLQLKVVWKMWDFKDLSNGDTSSYFHYAYRWFERQQVDIVWSPVYTAFYGSLLHIFSSVYATTILHRLIVIFVVTVLVLLLMRKLLPASIAWLISAWWVVLSINFNTLYEVHLFSLIPLLFASLCVSYKSTSLSRGVAVATLLLSALLIRNEGTVTTLVFVLICMFWEFQDYKTTERRQSYRKYVVSYGLPIAVSLLITLFFWTRSLYKFSEVASVARVKHVLNICQVYAFGYQQRHPEWNYSPWTECDRLMQQTFGQPMPSVVQALIANPVAFLEHIWWNISLTLSGIQISLFDASSGSINPDYIPTQLNVGWIIAPTILVGAILVGGLILLYKEREHWWNSWLHERALGWAVLLSNAFVTCFLVIPTQRPRSSYMFGLSVLLMAAIGMSLFIIFHRWSAFKNLNGLVPVIMIALIVAVPSHYNSSERRLLDLYNRFQPFQNIIAKNNTVLLTREYSFELCSYLIQKEACQPKSYADEKIFAGITPSTPLEAVLEKQKVNLFYADANLIAKLKSSQNGQKFPTSLYSAGWKLIGGQDDGNSQWMLLQKLGDRASSKISTSNKTSEDYCLRGMPKDLLSALSVPDCLDISR